MGVSVAAKPISFSERVVAAFVAFLAAATTAGLVQAGSIMFGGWVPLFWLGLFIGLFVRQVLNRRKALLAKT